MTLYQELKQKFILPNAYNDWKEYREFLTDLLIKCGQGLESIAIIGAGRCNDVDLRRLCAEFESITLIDVDSEGMESAINRISTEDCKKIRKKKLSLTGITEDDTATICERILASVRELGRGITADSYRDIIIRALDKVEINHPDAMESYDLILCNGVCSQLFSILSYFIRSLSVSVSRAAGIDVTDIQCLVDQRFREMNDRLIPGISEMIRNAVSHYAIFGNEYSEKSPVEGAYQCIKANRKSGHVQEELMTKWSFNSIEDVIYDMLIQICRI